MSTVFTILKWSVLLTGVVTLAILATAAGFVWVKTSNRVTMTTYANRIENTAYEVAQPIGDQIYFALDHTIEKSRKSVVCLAKNFLETFKTSVSQTIGRVCDIKWGA